MNSPAQFIKGEEGQEFPDFPDRLQTPSLYVFDRDGILFAERHNSVTHRPLKNLATTDLFPITGRLLPAWEEAMSGKTASWISHDHPEDQYFFLTLTPYGSQPGKPEYIIGWITPLDRSSTRWLAEQGFPIVR